MWCSKTGYDARVEALLDMGAAGLVESLLRQVCCAKVHQKLLIYESQVNP